MRHERKSILCKFGYHSTEREYYLVNRNKEGKITSRSAYCKRCGKKLYLVDRYGYKRRDYES